MIELTGQEKLSIMELAEHPFFTRKAVEKLSILEASIIDHITRGKPRPLFQTYLIGDVKTGLFKIGRAKDVAKRFNAIRSHNAYAELIWSYPVDIEKPLHVVFHSRRFFREWFRLEVTDVHKIKNIK